jgi:S-DNA-T family DNA segregation ATPase FtsK/SpoIIIE
MARKKRDNNKKVVQREKKSRFVLPEETKRALWGIFLLLIAVLMILSFFRLAGRGGKIFMELAIFLMGRTIFAIPLLLVLASIAVWSTQRKKFLFPIFFALLFTILGVDGILGTIGIYYDMPRGEMGGLLGYAISFLPMSFFDIWGSLVIFIAFIAMGLIAAWQLTLRERESMVQSEKKGGEAPPSILKKVLTPKFEVKEISSASSPSFQKAFDGPPVLLSHQTQKSDSTFHIKPLFLGDKKEKKNADESAMMIQQGTTHLSWNPPPYDLLEQDRGEAQSGDIKVNSAIIKRTLENFGIPVEISEVNVGPTVTQYALKPAEGVKLSRIVSLSNDLALALAAHPVRIEAPIPGRPLVGIEVPNRVRAQVRLRNLLENSAFQEAPSLTFALGRDVAGNPVYADLARMPHLLIAGSTGTGKTIGLNTIVISLLYKNSPDILRFILIDPKRVEFSAYNELPHLLTPVIYDAHKTVNALKWLVGEMERRFDVLSSVKARDIVGYNAIMLKEREEPMPYILLVVDELADLMAARGRDIEAGIVRLAQMARAVGIHLIVATQRPSVEVITGLIKANITSRIAFQVASQVDSRTILDIAGAEKLLGLGDMLFVSSEMSKPRRLQGAYVSDKEVRKVVKFLKEQAGKEEAREGEQIHGVEKLAEDLEKILDQEQPESFDTWEGGEDPLYEEAKRLVIEMRKASASFLQRRLRIGYARAARLIDMLEERGVVGPGEGAKPREVLLGVDSKDRQEENEDEWEKI